MKYESAELTIVAFEAEDIITDSNGLGDQEFPD